MYVNRGLFPILTMKMKNNLFCLVVFVKEEINLNYEVDPDGPVVIILAIRSEVHGFKPGRGRWISSEYKS